MATLRCLLALLSLLSPGLSSPAQTTAPLPAGLLEQIVQQERDYLVALPSLTAEETITSTGPGFPFKRKATAVATMRVRRRSADEPGTGLIEQRTFVSFEGRPVAADDGSGKPQRTVDGKLVHLPLTLTGAFGDFAEEVLSEHGLACLRFSLREDAARAATHEIAFEAPGAGPDSTAGAHPDIKPGCERFPASVKGLLLVDRQTHHLLHFERTVDEQQTGRAHKIATFASVDLAPTQVGPDTFWLPTVITAELAGFSGTFVARYANYHRYSGAVTILPGVTTLPAESPQP